jgi:hypothetical protein
MKRYITAACMTFFCLLSVSYSVDARSLTPKEALVQRFDKGIRNCGIDTSLILKWITVTADISENQKQAIMSLADGCTDDTILTVTPLIYLALNEKISDNKLLVLQTIIKFAKNGNDLYEDHVATVLLVHRGYLDDAQTQKLSDCVRNARYGNGISDTNEFLKILLHYSN